MKLFHPYLKCSEAMRPHIDLVLEGEYDIPLLGVGLTILDLGANIGAFSLWAAHRWPYSIIYAYEPEPRNFEALLLNTHFLKGAVIPKQIALGKSGLRTLFLGRNNEGEHSLFGESDSGGEGIPLSVESPLILPQADILKIDTEGAELEILEPLIREGRTFQAILLEYHSESARREIDKLLKDYTLVGSSASLLGQGILKYMRLS